ncbi:TniQ family protein [Luteibacter yeojuensis]|uniref:TniQ family protein n=1 Tax=Luteibacter yeojuensis TaxID=345309 RepID=UPI0009FEDE03
MSSGGVERWTIPGPGPDESLESVIERADRYYQGWLTGLGRRLDVRPATSGAGEGSAAAPASTADIRALASRLDVPAVKLLGHRLSGGPEHLEPHQRRAFCACCWAADDRLGRPRAFRRAWANIWCLTCPVHGMPLSWCHAAPGLESPEEIIARWGIDRDDPAVTAQLSAVQCLLDLCATRPRFRREVQLMAAVVSDNWAPIASPSLMEGFQRPGALARWLVPVRRRGPALRSPLDALKRLGHPGARRAAMAAVATSLTPSTGPSLPHGLPYRPFEVWDMQWQQASPHYARRQRRFYAYLRTLASAWWGPQHVPALHPVTAPLERWARRRSPMIGARRTEGSAQ